MNAPPSPINTEEAKIILEILHRLLIQFKEIKATE